MRHRVQRHSLGVSSSHRASLMGNMASSLIEHGRIRTTLAKAKALRPFMEKSITLAKKAKEATDAKDSLHYRRQAISRLRNVEMVHKLFDEKVEEFVDRNGGYTRIYKLGARRGDAAEMALIELIPASDEGYEKKKKKSSSKPKAKKEEPKAEESTPVEEAKAEEKPVKPNLVELAADGKNNFFTPNFSAVTAVEAYRQCSANNTDKKAKADCATAILEVLWEQR